MTFRTRLVLAATVAVVFAVLVAAIASYFAASNALINSLDNSLSSRASASISDAAARGRPLDQNDFYGEDASVIPPTCPSGGDALPVTGPACAVASGRARPYFATVQIKGTPYRELVTPVPPGILVSTSAGVEEFPNGGALQLATPLSGVNSQLTNLGLALTAVAIAGILLAILLGWLVARTALVPLDELTSAVEDVAETTDVSKRLDAGGPDELGRLRRAFNRLLAALERSHEAQRQLVLDATHELRTPLTSLRTNLEVVRRIEELSASDRTVLVDDVLTQMQELTTLVGDLAELARGEQRQEQPAPLRLDQVVEDAVAVATTHGRSRGVSFEVDTRPTWVTGRRERPRPGRGQPARQRPQVEPRRRPGGGDLLGRRGVGARPRSGHRAGGPAPRLRPLLPGAGRPGPARLGARAGHRGPGGPGRRRAGQRLSGRGRRGAAHPHPPGRARAGRGAGRRLRAEPGAGSAAGRSSGVLNDLSTRFHRGGPRWRFPRAKEHRGPAAGEDANDTRPPPRVRRTTHRGVTQGAGPTVEVRPTGCRRSPLPAVVGPGGGPPAPRAAPPRRLHRPLRRR